MRRKDREVKNEKELLEIIKACKVCRIATQDSEGLYIIPMNFGYEYGGQKLTLFLHSAKTGRKAEAFCKNHTVAFEMDCAHRLIEASTACEYGYQYRSIVGIGEISLLDTIEEKKEALSALMRHQTGKAFSFNTAMADTVAVYKIDASEFTAKQHL